MQYTILLKNRSFIIDIKTIISWVFFSINTFDPSREQNTKALGLRLEHRYSIQYKVLSSHLPLPPQMLPSLPHQLRCYLESHWSNWWTCPSLCVESEQYDILLSSLFFFFLGGGVELIFWIILTCRFVTSFFNISLTRLQYSKTCVWPKSCSSYFQITYHLRINLCL